MGALLPLLMSLAPSLIQGVEKLFQKPTATAKMGPDKMDAVLKAIKQIADQMIAAKVPLPDGTVASSPPTDDALRGMIEGVLGELKGTGQLSATGSTEPPMFYLVKGSVTPLK